MSDREKFNEFAGKTIRFDPRGKLTGIYGKIMHRDAKTIMKEKAKAEAAAKPKNNNKNKLEV